MLNTIRKLRREEDGVTIVEFGLIAPTLMFMLMGLFELGHGMYVQSIVNGVMQEAGRDSTLEGASEDDMRILMEARVLKVAPKANITLSWANFESFTEIGALEEFNDIDGDGQCSVDEPFEDTNGNGVHDYKYGDDGIGDAREAVVFRTTVEYERMFPMPSMGGWSATNVVEGVTVLENQPYAETEYTPPIGKCTGMEDHTNACKGIASGLNCRTNNDGPGVSAGPPAGAGSDFCDDYPILCSVGDAIFGSV